MQKLVVACLLTFLIVATAVPVSGAGQSQTVLVIYSNHQSLPANREIDDAIRETLGADTHLDLRYQTEFLDYPRFGDVGDKAYDKLVSDFLREKYAGQSIDAMVAVGLQAFQLLSRHRDDLFPDMQVLVVDIPRSVYENQPLPAGFLAIPIEIKPLATLKLAVRLQPEAREIVVVTGVSNYDLASEQSTRSALTAWQEHPPVRYLSGLPLDSVLSELTRLPHSSIVYVPSLLQDGNGKTYATRDVVLNPKP